MCTRRELLRGALSLGAATAAWATCAAPACGLPTASLFEGGPLPAWVRELVTANLTGWEAGDPARLVLAGRTNPEWAFMGRTFLGLAAANLALREPDRAKGHTAALDRILDHTLDLEARHGFRAFLMAYGQGGGWRRQPPASVFVDGEIAALLAARALLPGGEARIGALRARLRKLSAAMRDGPVLSAESYPDECWTFCNSFALAALQLGRAAGVEVDPDLPGDWLATARIALRDPRTGLLPASYRHDGSPLDGPEGSSLWITAHNLLLVDPDYAADQYRRGTDALQRQLLGFGWAREWPPAAPGRPDVDSGPIVPILQASPGSSGLALVGAAAFGDRPRFDALLASLQLVGCPQVRDGGRRYLASNAVGDAVLLYAAVQGPLWDLARRRLG